MSVALVNAYNKDAPLVSVIMAVKDGERFLEEALRSVLASGYPRLEIVAIDASRDDCCCKILNSSGKVRYLRQTGSGIPEAYNQGIASSQGELVAFLSHDDRWAPDKIEKQAQALTERPELGFVLCKAEYFLDSPDGGIPAGFRRELLDHPRDGYMVEALMARRSLFGKLGDFRTDLSLAHDVDWFSRAKDRGVPFEIVPEVLLFKRVHGGNASLNVDESNSQILRLLKSSLDRKRSGVH